MSAVTAQHLQQLNLEILKSCEQKNRCQKNTNLFLRSGKKFAKLYANLSLLSKCAIKHRRITSFIVAADVAAIAAVVVVAKGAFILVVKKMLQKNVLQLFSHLTFCQ